MASTLLIAKLSIKSSYAENAEHDADESNFDTVQWWLSDSEAWRVKTHALDNDIHTHLVSAPVAPEVAIENTRKHYGDVIAEKYVVEFSELMDAVEAEAKMALLGGASTLEFSRDKRFAFWNADQRRYSSTTSPQG